MARHTDLPGAGFQDLSLLWCYIFNMQILEDDTAHLGIRHAVPENLCTVLTRFDAGAGILLISSTCDKKC